MGSGDGGGDGGELNPRVGVLSTILYNGGGATVSSEGTRLRLREGDWDGRGDGGGLGKRGMRVVAGLWVFVCFVLCRLPDNGPWCGKGRVSGGFPSC